MTPDEADEGGEAPCFGHLFDEPPAFSDQVLADLVRRLADAVVIAGRDGRIELWNDAATRVFGWTADEAVGQSLDVIIPERLRARHWAGYHQTMTTGQTSYGDRLLEVPALHRDGRTLSIAFTVTLLRAADDTPHAIAAVIRDDTQRWHEHKRLREEIAALQEQVPADTAGHEP